MKRPRFSDRKLPVAYFTALGRFNDRFTAAEVDLAATISLFATSEICGTAYDIVRSLLGGARMKPAKDSINRILRVMKVEKPIREHVAKVFNHLGEIQWFRDRLAHNLTQRSGRGIGTDKTFINTGIDTYREWEKAVTFGFDLSAIEAASDDLDVIPNHLADIFEACMGERPMPDLMLPSWRYKPSMLDR